MNQLETYADQINKCSHCGYCQAVCPVYLNRLEESLTAKNRVNLVKNCLLDHTIPISPRFDEIISSCLLCTSCTHNCPSQVPVDEIIVAARHRRRADQPLKFSLRQRTSAYLLKRRSGSRLLARLGSVAQSLQLASSDLPPLARKPFPTRLDAHYPANGPARARVAYYVGCGTVYFYPDTAQAVIQTLNINGIDVIVPGGLNCCGIPFMAEGDLESCQKLMRLNIGILAGLDVDAIVTDCTSCGMMIKEKASRLFAADDPIQEKIALVAGKIADYHLYLLSGGLISLPAEYTIAYSYHVPCHKGWAEQLMESPLKLLQQIPGASYQALDDPASCCGAGGTYYLDHKDLAAAIRAPKVSDIMKCKPDLLVTQCPVCRFYLASALEEIEVIHPAILLARAYQTANND